ncbi:MAG: acetolactate synthase [Actinobacteria bacterium]|nr:acetolactate synthase [Actinomycetota bacterium]
MSVRQLSVFVENRTGHLSAALDTLADAEVNIQSFTIADTTDYGILRLVVDRVDVAKQILAANDFAVVEHPVVSAVVPDRPGELAAAMRIVADSGIDIDYIYLGGRNTLLLRAEEYERLEALLIERGFHVLHANELL